MVEEQYLKQLPKAIVQWYEVKKGSRAACLTAGCGNSVLIAEALEERGIYVDRIPLDKIECLREYKGERKHDYIDDRESEKKIYDYVLAIDVIEYTQDAGEVLRYIRGLLKSDGKLLLAADNRLGIRYFCGDRDSFTCKNYDGIENYKHLLSWERETMNGRAYSKAELTRFLEKAGFYGHRFFSVFPRIENPQILLAEDYEPNEALDIRVFPEYNNPDTVFLFEEELYPDLIENKLLHPMANGFFVECPLNSDYVPVNQVTLSGERGEENAMATVIRSDGVVEKRALYPAGRKRLRQLLENHEYLSAHGVKLIDTKQKEDSIVMPYVSGIPATDYFRELLKQDKETFLQQLDAFWDIVMHSGTPVDYDGTDRDLAESGKEMYCKDKASGDKQKRTAPDIKGEKEALGVILKRGYPDLVSLNCFYIDGEFVFYDQEMYLENVPAKAIMYRTIEFIYKFHDQLDAVLPRDELFERYGMIKYKALYDKVITSFLNMLRRDDELSDYFREGRREYGTVLENRRRMNYSEKEYSLIFKDIFHDIEGRRLYLFGSGKYAQRFREKYGTVYSITGYLDNDEERWGTEMDGILISAPAILKEIKPEEYKVMICIKNYLPVVRQLQKEGIRNFSVYDPDAD